MLLTEQGLHFRRDGDRWGCVEWPGLVMLRGDRFEVEGQSRAARTGLSHQCEPRSLTRGTPDLPGQGGT